MQAEQDRQAESRDLWAGYKFNNLLIGCRTMKESPEIVLNFIKEYAEQNLLSLLNLSSDKNPAIHHYCYLDEENFRAFWDELLVSNKAFIQLKIIAPDINLNLKVLKNIHSLDFIKAFFWYTKALNCYKKQSGPNNSVEKLLLYIDEAVSYGSLQGGCLLLDIYLELKNIPDVILKPESVEKSLQHLANLHLSPGYLLLAKFYLHEKMHQECRDCIIKAKELLPESENEICNSPYRQPEMITRLNDLENNVNQLEIGLRSMTL